ncbi:MAG TPA: hypothetical protein VGF94_02515 [Kofleriaceae bacterium]|jgi:hypothetical protein
MQKVAVYLLERREGMEWSKPRSAEAQLLRDEVLKWLAAKGGTANARSGTFKPEDNGSGSFLIEDAVDGDRTWWILELQEATADGRRFASTISITAGADKIAVYVTLEVGWATARIVPASDSDPKCPRIIRTLLDLPGRWYHGSSTFRPLQLVRGFEDGEALAVELAHRDRSIPFVVVSADGERTALPQLDERLAYDLAGLANVVRVDEDASWALTDVLGPGLCCYWGAVRLYWPHLGGNDRGFHPLWTGERLRSSGHDAFATRERFRKQIRGLIFPAAALSIVRPREIDSIRDAAERAATTTLRDKASSVEEFQKLADSYAVDADKLRDERTTFRAKIEELEAHVAKLEADRLRLEADRLSLQAHLNAKSQPAAPPPDEIAPEVEAEDAGPAPGEVRFYKKIHSTPTHDIMKRVQDCGCDNWESSHAADKARKGIAKLEGKNDWNQMQHCASCTGGGMWRVRW